MNDGYVDMWDNWAKKRQGIPVYDNWLLNYQDILDKNGKKLILDLGCGNGADSLFLVENGYNVLATDFSKEALKNVSQNIGGISIKQFDMRKTFPFKDNSFYLIIADLSLYYFSEKETITILNEIKRILVNGGVLLARVARVDDYNFMNGDFKELEHNYYFEGAYTKRFFEEKDVKSFFSIVGDVSYNKTEMTRNEEEYQKVKKLYEVVVKKED